MSKSILLTKYSQNENMQLSEAHSKIIEKTSIPEDIFEELSKSCISVISIYEEDSEEQYDQQIINSDSIMHAIDLIIELYNDKCAKYFSNELSLKEKDILLDEMTYLLNIRKLFKLKKEKYLNDVTIELIVG